MKVVQRGFFVLLLSLSTLSQLYGNDKYFSWLDPNLKQRARIDLITGELLKESTPGNWRVHGTIKVDPGIVLHLPPTVSNHYFFSPDSQKLIFTLAGTGQVFELNFLSKTLKRIDQTFYSGYNFGADVFERNAQIYSVGGVGFWTYSRAITYFDKNTAEWQAIRPKNFGPESIFDGYQGYSKLTDKFYTGGSEEGKYLENNPLGIDVNCYVYDFKTNEWTLLGEINAELLEQQNREIIWNGNYFVQFSREKVYLIDPVKNAVFVYKSNKEQFQGGEYRYAVGDEIYCYWNRDNGPISKLSIREIESKAIYLGPFYSPPSKWLYYAGIGFGSLALLGLFYFRKRTKEAKKLTFDLQEKLLLKSLMDLTADSFLSTVEVNEILGLSGKTLENQRRIRLNIIAQVNQKIQLFFQIDNAIERHPSPEDKRLSRYSLNSAALKVLKNQF